MSDSENYFSDSDKSIDNNEVENLEEEEDSEYEMDEETRQIIYNASLKNMNKESTFFGDGVVPKKPKKLKNKKVKEVKYLSFQDFQSKLEDEKPKKWKGKRFQNKKDELGISSQKIIKRRFNPRLPPPTVNTFKKEEEKDLDISPTSEEQFPTLDSAKDLNV